MSWLSSFLKPGKGYEKGQEQLDKYYQQANNFIQPYNQQGQEQYNTLNDYIKSLSNPEQLHNQWAQGYQESPSAINARDMAMQHGLNSASSMGLLGSNSALNALQKGAADISMNDRENYLDRIMQKYMQGAGLSQGIYNTGANASSALSNNAMNMGQSSAQMAYGQQAAGGNMFGNLLGAGIGAAGMALGGPMGGALASRWNLAGGK